MICNVGMRAAAAAAAASVACISFRGEKPALSIVLSLLAGSCSVAVKQALLRFRTIPVKLSPPAEFNSPSLITSSGGDSISQIFCGEGGALDLNRNFLVTNDILVEAAAFRGFRSHFFYELYIVRTDLFGS